MLLTFRELTALSTLLFSVHFTVLDQTKCHLAELEPSSVLVCQGSSRELQRLLLTLNMTTIRSSSLVAWNCDEPSGGLVCLPNVSLGTRVQAGSGVSAQRG